MRDDDATERWLKDVPADPAHTEAADWLLRMQSASASGQVKDDFLVWMDQDPRHVAAFVELVWTSYGTWAACSPELRFVQKMVEQRYAVGAQISKRPAPQTRRAYSIAASIALVVCLGGALTYFGSNFLTMVPSSEVRTTTFDTPVGENRTVVLDDSSRLTLGGRTTVEVAISTTERNVTLREGEAYFEVAKESRKFTVHTGTTDVVAVGTKFNINSTNDRSIVTVTEGRVLVTSQAQELYLNAGEQTTATKDSVGSVTSVSDLPAVISWPMGRLSFRQRALREAVYDVNRYASKPIVLAPEVGDFSVTGTLVIGNIGSWVKSLERAFDLTATEEADRIVIRPSRMN